ncbi:MAG: glutathione synthetase [Sphingobacteriales bacterium]|nr:MAG: glutathione synthetase [Sphingobacteriales bacterium]
MDQHVLLGFIAATCTTAAFVPQVIRTVKSRDTSGISLGMYVLFMSGTLLWLAYGWFTGNEPVIIANAVTFVLAAVVLTYKLGEYRGRNRKS